MKNTAKTNQVTAVITICLIVIILSRLTQSYFIGYWFREVLFDSVTEGKFYMGIGGQFLFEFVYHLPVNMFYLLGGYCLALLAWKFWRGIFYSVCLGVVGGTLLYFPLTPVSIVHVYPLLFAVTGAMSVDCLPRRQAKTV